MSAAHSDRHMWRQRISWTGVLLTLLSWMGGCNSDSDAIGPVNDPQPIPPSPFVVSDPVAVPGSVGGAGAGPAATLSGAADAVVYVSLAEGEIPTGTSASIENRRTGTTVTTPLVAGGFDPVAVEASAGDTLEVEVSAGPNSLRFLLRVPATAPPIVVRTEPTAGKRDVPLNARIIIVFSEPIDPATMTGATIRVNRGTTAVPGTVQFADAEGLTAEFVPDEPMAPETDYELVVTQGIKDRDGAPLQAALGATFTTSSASATRLVFTVQPSDAVEGSPISPAVEVTVQDPFGNVVTSFTDSVTIALGQGPDGAFLAGTTSVAAIGGVATFADLRARGNGVGFYLRARANDLVAVTSTPFQVAASTSATRLVFTVQPSETFEGSPINPAVEVTVQDVLGNTLTDFADSVTLAPGPHTIGGTLAGTVKVAAIQGVATFGDLWVVGGETGFTLIATAPGLTSEESAVFGVGRDTVTAGLDSIRVRILDAETQAPLPSIARPQMFAAPISEPTHQRRVALYSDGSGTVGLLPAGTWSIAVTAVHGWTLVFPGLQLYSDTTLTVEVIAGETTVLPDLLLRPRAPLLLVGVERCPWALPDPPTAEDWGDCDSGYWGGVDVQIEVNGVAGTSTEGVHYEGIIGPADATWWATSWDNTPWSAYFDIAIPGEYDVEMVNVSPSSSGAIWELVPWRPAVVRVTVESGHAYVEFDFWHK